ncbi:MAG: hypothetical protein JST84_33035 [Acidobacteria bacterium]|nr:hypothetical protein [Acidobacteriota bacterium]
MKHIGWVAFLLFGVLVGAETIAMPQPASKQPRLYKPSPAKIATFEDAARIALAGGLRVCKAKVADSGEGKFIVQQGGKTLGEWEAQFSVYSDAKSFEVLEIDLDGNGANEIIVAEFTAQSNGMGVKYYNLFILADPRKNAFQSPVSFQMADYSAYGNFIKEPNSNETFILVTNWESRELAGKEDSYATYLTGRWFRYHNGKLQPAFEKPILARRLLKSFEQLRLNTLEDNVHPYSWLKHPKTEKLKTDPMATGIEVSAQNGVIEKYTRIEKKRAEDDDRVQVIQQIVVKFDSGQTATFRLYPDLDADEEPNANKAQEINQIGFLPAQFLLPESVTIFAVYDKLEGRQVRIVTYKGASEDVQPITMWLVEK